MRLVWCENPAILRALLGVEPRGLNIPRVSHGVDLARLSISEIRAGCGTDKAELFAELLSFVCNRKDLKFQRFLLSNREMLHALAQWSRAGGVDGTQRITDLRN